MLLATAQQSFGKLQCTAICVPWIWPNIYKTRF